MSEENNGGPALPHALEPWEYETPLHIVSKNGSVVARCSATIGKYEFEEANARRIVACVNACKGASTEVLECGAAHDWALLMTELEAQRDELAKVLKDTVKLLGNNCTATEIMLARHQAEMVITKLEATNGSRT